MGMTPERILLLFRSVHEVLAAERHLKEVATEIDVVPVPKELSPNCGVALEVAPEQLQPIVAVLRRERLQPEEVYSKMGNEYVIREMD